MKNEYMIITLTPDEITEFPFVNVETACGDFYHLIGEKFAPYEKITTIDCTKVNVAKNIQESWYEYARKNGIKTSDLTMLLLFSGPKAPETIKGNCVELEAGAIEWN